MRVERQRLGFDLTTQDGQEITIWTWEGKDTERAAAWVNQLERVDGVGPIDTWTDWPDDIRPLLRKWNVERRLRFVYTWNQKDPALSEGSQFTCTGCTVEALRNRYGTAELDGSLYCDDCLKKIARGAHGQD